MDRGCALRQMRMDARRAVQRMASPLRKPSNDADAASAATPAASREIRATFPGTGDFGPLRRCSSLQGDLPCFGLAPGIVTEIDPSHTPVLRSEAP